MSRYQDLELPAAPPGRPRQAAWVLLLGAAAGLLAVGAAALLRGDALRLLTCVALPVPAVTATWLLLRRRSGVVPLLVGLGSMLLFLPRLINVDAGTGLLAAAQLTPQELERALATTELVLIVFSVFLALSFVFAARHPAVAQRWAVPAGGGHAARLLEGSVRVRIALGVGVVAGVGALVNGLTQGLGARDFENAGQGGPLALLSPAPAAGALWLAGKRSSALAVLGLSVAGPFLTGGRQAVLTPLLYFLVAVLVRRRVTASGQQVLSVKAITAWALLAAVVIGGAVIGTTTQRAEVETALNKGVQPSLYASAVERQTLLDPLVVAVAREDRPQWLRIYSRALAIPIPRMLWPDKPLSYDYHFRERQFPHYGGGIPITLPGTAFLSFLLPGVALAALLLGLGAVAADVLVSGRTTRSVLLGVALCLFLLDALRVGGLYREVLTATIDVALIMVVTCRAKSLTAGHPAIDASPPALVRP